MQVGQVIGRFRVVEALGKGGMASVYAGEHVVLGHRVAIKVLHAHHCANPAMEARFSNEARTISALEHPGIVALFDIGQTADGRAYVVMELLRGEPLSSRLCAGAISIGDALGFARQLASALGAAHRHGIVHRDLKPDNIFVVPDPDLPRGERLKVLDFGIAKRTAVAPSRAQITRTGMLVGTPGYMSPEQCSGAQDVDERADIYSLGVVLYYMVTGAPPFSATTPEELIAEQLYCEPPPAAQVSGSVPQALSDLIARCMEREPEDRFASMDEVLAALEALDSGVVSAELPAREPPAERDFEGGTTLIRSAHLGWRQRVVNRIGRAGATAGVLACVAVASMLARGALHHQEAARSDPATHELSAELPWSRAAGDSLLTGALPLASAPASAADEPEIEMHDPAPAPADQALAADEPEIEMHDPPAAPTASAPTEERPAPAARRPKPAASERKRPAPRRQAAPARVSEPKPPSRKEDRFDSVTAPVLF